ncbi:hypothetical protein AALP_AA7G160200 [Arabis alpina]|uniref:Uncharacterized protein n=1 Tax=Arabis alpina TaxID=50452 RepID=A0A087GIE2_ARAAL|nr:hypothetical protein AALP_AA7G160200 [Arabis alpina]
MKRHYQNLLIIISIFFIVSAFSQELQCCSDKTVHAVHTERPIVGVSDTKVAHGISQMSKARAVYGGDSIIKPKRNKNNAIASTTRSASLALLQVIVVTMVYLFLY